LPLSWSFSSLILIITNGGTLPRVLICCFAGCWLLIFVAKIVMTPLLQRPEDYYDDGGDDDDE
jgi:hypothetical protein